jgi:UDP-N-acetylmuramoyl-L-alanyl-D-glutamate--2,6-diaminopimelate ligase
MGTRLSQLLSGMELLEVEGDLDREVSGVTADSRRVFPGMVFVAVRGRRADGHDYLGMAVDRGAAAVISERGGLGSRRAVWVRVRDTRRALGRLAAGYYGHPSRGMRVIGVTGTNGKTVVSWLIRHLLEAAGQRSGLVGTVCYEVGGRTIPAQRTTPDAVEIQHLLAQMRRAGCAACVMEVSSHALDQGRVDEVEFDVGVFTNLTHDHLEYHGTAEDYFRSKRRLFEMLGDGGKPGAAVVNIDDGAGARLEGEARVQVRSSFGMQETAMVMAREVELGLGGTRMTVETPEGTFGFWVPLVGRFNVYNVLAAVGAGRVLGIPQGVMAEAFRCAPQVPGRLERVDLGQPFSVFVDYAHTEDALRNVLGMLREITPGRLWVVFGCGGERDPGKRGPMGRAAGELADGVVVTSDNPRRERPGVIAASVVAGLREADGARWCVELDRGRAIQELVSRAGVGDTVLVAGKGHETYQEFEDTVVPCDDRMHVRAALEALGWRGGGCGAGGGDGCGGMLGNGWVDQGVADARGTEPVSVPSGFRAGHGRA